jgi:hypothetical protein
MKYVVGKPTVQLQKENIISQTQNSLVFYGTYNFYASYDDIPIIYFMVPNNDFDNEYALNMQYDNA